MPSASLDTVHAVRQVWLAPVGVRIRRWPVGLASRGPAARATRPCRRLGAAASVVATTVDRNKVATSWLRAGRGVAGRLGASGWPADGSGAPPPPRPGWRPCGDGRGRRTTRPGRPWRRLRFWAAGSRGGCWPWWSSWRGKRWSPPALDLPLDSVVGHVLPLHRRGVTVVLTLDPDGCTVVTRIGW